MIEFIDDLDVWAQCPTDWLWVYDKLIVARKQNISAGPAGIPVQGSKEEYETRIKNLYKNKLQPDPEWWPDTTKEVRK